MRINGLLSVCIWCLISCKSIHIHDEQITLNTLYFDYFETPVHFATWHFAVLMVTIASQSSLSMNSFCQMRMSRFFAFLNGVSLALV